VSCCGKAAQNEEWEDSEGTVEIVDGEEYQVPGTIEDEAVLAEIQKRVT